MRRPLALGSLALLALVAPSARGRDFQPDEWVEVRSEHFAVYSDAGRERAEEIATSLEGFRAVFARLAPEIALHSAAPTTLLAFRDADSYAPYKTLQDHGEARVLGQFLTYPDGNYLTVDADPRYLGAFAVAFHEYVHYLVRGNFPWVPRWFNEGLAEYYSTFAIEDGGAVVGRPVERHLAWLGGRRELGLRSVLEAWGGSGEGEETVEEGRRYAVSWGLVHYLLSGGPETADELTDLLLPRGTVSEQPIAAFERVMGERVEAVEERLERYLRGELPRAVLPLGDLPELRPSDSRTVEPAQLLSVLGGLLARQGSESAAEERFDLALRYDPRSPAALAGLADLRDRQHRTAEAETLYREAMAEQPADPQVWLLFGRHLLATLREGAGGSVEADGRIAREARDVLGRAVDLAPEFGEAQGLLGYLHLFGGLDPAEGIPHLERAIELLPGRADLLVEMVHLRLANGEGEAARSLIEGELARVGTPDLVERAREDAERWELLTAANLAYRGGDGERALELLAEAVRVTSDPALRGRLEDRLETLRAHLRGER